MIANAEAACMIVFSLWRIFLAFSLRKEWIEDAQTLRETADRHAQVVYGIGVAGAWSG